MSTKRLRSLKLLFMALLFLIPSLGTSSGDKKIRVVASTETVGDIVKMVGGDVVEIESLSRGTEDPHYIEAKPSFMVKVRDADLVVSVGLDLEDAWLTPVIKGGRNPKLLPGESGNLSLGDSVTPIEKITGKVDRSQGDVHPKGNPHYYLDPERVALLLPVIANKLSELRPDKKAYFDEQAKRHSQQLAERIKQWKDRVKKSGIKSVITYHKTFQYPLELFKVQLAQTLEPKPGLPPTTRHILNVLEKVKTDRITCILNENHFEISAAERVKKDSPVYIAKVPTEVGGSSAARDYYGLIESIVLSLEACGQFTQNLSKAKGAP